MGRTNSIDTEAGQSIDTEAGQSIISPPHPLISQFSPPNNGKRKEKTEQRKGIRKQAWHFCVSSSNDCRQNLLEQKQSIVMRLSTATGMVGSRRRSIHQQEVLGGGEQAGSFEPTAAASSSGCPVRSFSSGDNRVRNGAGGSNRRAEYSSSASRTGRTRIIHEYQRQARWVVASVCVFVTFQFIWTIRMYLVLSNGDDGMTEVIRHHHHGNNVAFFNPPLELKERLRSTVAEATIDEEASMMHIEGLMINLRGTSSGSSSGDDFDDDGKEDDFRIVFVQPQQPEHVPARTTTTTTTIQLPEPGHENWKFMSHDYGGLQLSLGLKPGIPRAIRDDEESINDKQDKKEGAQDVYYAFDDDFVRGGELEEQVDDKVEKLKDTQQQHCRRIQEHRLAFPTCNEVHQLDHTGGEALRDSDFRFMNNGAFREVFSYTHHYYKSQQQQTDNKVAIKEIVYEDISEGEDYYEYVRMDAIVAERLTASPRIYDIYGYCGLSIVSEFFYHGDLESRAIGGDEDGRMQPKDLHDELAVNPQNNLTAAQKLVLALDMAEGLADLHGYENGLMIHDDVQLSQFLMSEDRTRVKLNDFNRAEFPLWDEEHEQYCRYQNGQGHGNWRSPEEYKDEPLTEAIDVWSLGNNFYGLLTGLSPFYELDNETGKHTKKTRKRVVKGETPFIDPRYYLQQSPEERALVEVIKRCFEYAPEDRPTIFEIVDDLRQAVSELVVDGSKGISRQAVLQQL
jgi:hypothetical protein